jgi:hypothetical protein
MREVIEDSPGAKEYGEELYKALGMTADEFWNEYKIKYESPADLTSIKIAEYHAQMGITGLTEKEILRIVNSN